MIISLIREMNKIKEAEERAKEEAVKQQKASIKQKAKVFHFILV